MASVCVIEYRIQQIGWYNRIRFIILGVQNELNKHQQKDSYVTSAEEACAAKDDEEDPPPPPSDASAKASSSWGIILEFTFASMHLIRTVRPECHRTSVQYQIRIQFKIQKTKPPCHTKNNEITGIFE